MTDYLLVSDDTKETQALHVSEVTFTFKELLRVIYSQILSPDTQQHSCQEKGIIVYKHIYIPLNASDIKACILVCIYASRRLLLLVLSTPEVALKTLN